MDADVDADADDGFDGKGEGKEDKDEWWDDAKLEEQDNPNVNQQVANKSTSSSLSF